MSRLRLIGNGITIDLDGLLSSDTGVQAIAGAFGFGLPKLRTFWSTGAGDGARYRGARSETRDIDLPLYLDGGTPSGLTTLLAQLDTALQGEPCTLRYVDGEGVAWSVDVYQVGGGDYASGLDNTPTTLRLLITLRAGSPYWRKEGPPNVVNIPSVEGSNRTVVLDNEGTAPAPIRFWIDGLVTHFRVTSPARQTIAWSGNPPTGPSGYIVFDSANSTAQDHLGANRYHELSTAPRFWHLPPGRSVVEYEIRSNNLSGTTAQASWSTHMRMVI